MALTYRLGGWVKADMDAICKAVSKIRTAEVTCTWANCAKGLKSPLMKSVYDLLGLVLERLRYTDSGLWVRVSLFYFSFFADVSIFTRNFYPFSPGKPSSPAQHKQVNETQTF